MLPSSGSYEGSSPADDPSTREHHPSTRRDDPWVGIIQAGGGIISAAVSHGVPVLLFHHDGRDTVVGAEIVDGKPVTWWYGAESVCKK